MYTTYNTQSILSKLQFYNQDWDVHDNIILNQFFPSFSFWNSKWKAIIMAASKFLPSRWGKGISDTLAPLGKLGALLLCIAIAVLFGAFFLFGAAAFLFGAFFLFSVAVFFFMLFYCPGSGPRFFGWTAVGVTTTTFSSSLVVLLFCYLPPYG